MVHPHLAKQKNHYAASFTLLQFSTQSLQQALNINPLYVTANRAAEDQLERLLVLAVHVITGTSIWYHLVAVNVHSVVAWIGAEMEFALSQAVASGGAFEHRPSECGHCVQDFLAELALRDLAGEAAGLESGADDALPTADLRFCRRAALNLCGI